MDPKEEAKREQTREYCVEGFLILGWRHHFRQQEEQTH